MIASKATHRLTALASIIVLALAAAAAAALATTLARVESPVEKGEQTVGE